MLQSVIFSNYRNLNLETDLSTRNIIISPNGSGKSNLLEGIYFSNFAKSFRPVSVYSELIGVDGSFGKIQANWSDTSIAAIVSDSGRVERRFEELGKRKPLKQIVARHNVVLFSPTTLDIVSGEPHVRRTDLDDFLTLRDIDYLEHLTRYQAILKNRNALLKILSDGRGGSRELQLFSEMLATEAAYIFEKRRDFFDEIQGDFVERSKGILSDELINFSLKYLPNLQPREDFRSELLQKYHDNEQKEIIVGKTLYGVHKDDYTFSINSAPLRYQGSRGQQRLASLVYKLIQLAVLRENEKETIFLVDDLMSELDERHRSLSLEILGALDTQIILTGASENDFQQGLIGSFDSIELN